MYFNNPDVEVNNTLNKLYNLCDTNRTFINKDCILYLGQKERDALNYLSPLEQVITKRDSTNRPIEFLYATIILVYMESHIYLRVPNSLGVSHD